jgi:hypothetical protein
VSRSGFDPEVATQVAEQSDPVGVNPMFAAKTELDRLPLSDVHLYHKNPRKGDPSVIASSLRVNGQYKPVVLNVGTHTGRPNEILAGNHTVIAMRDLAQESPDDERWHSVLVHSIDVDDDQAARIVAADNRTADLGKYDDEILVDLLAGLPDLEGTGYSDDDLAKLLGNNIIDGDADVSDAPRAFGIVIDCDTETQQVNLLERLENEGFNVRALM